ncbi:MAG: hypothetical protein ACKV2V_11020, partial [Blastocatellia bacterium]
MTTTTIHKLPALFTATLLLLLCAGAARAQNATAAQPAPATRETLNNEAIIRLAREGFKEKTILHLIRNSPIAFDLSVARLVELKRNKVSERIISEMIERQNIANGLQAMGSLRDDEFFREDDEAFFNGRRRAQAEPRAQNGAPARENETSIFGSSSGSQSRTQSRAGAGRGESSSQQDLSGTATVRIVRPPAESVDMKLERAPRLDNQAIVDMIQAGFSEGTIIRKIEITQVEFDLSSRALAEMRRNRASEKIIRAMTSAMHDGADK